MATRRKTETPKAAPAKGNLVKDPEDWATGDEPMTAAQQSYLHTLAGEAGEPVDDAMTKAEASEKIDDLRRKSDRVSGAARPKPKARRRS